MDKGLRLRNIVIGDGRPKICVPLIGTDIDEIREEARGAASSPADMMEWRADHFCDAEDEGALTACLRELRGIAGEMPVLFTLRSEVEGGAFRGSDELYRDIVTLAAGSGCVDIVDVELARLEGGQPDGDPGGRGDGKRPAADLIGAAHRCGVRVVASYHNFDATPAKAELTDCFCSMLSHDADILKIAVMPRDFNDVLTLMEATYEFAGQHKDKPVAGISMGRLGLITRLAGEAYGSAISFAAGRRGGSAPGQISAEDVDEMLRIIHETT